LTVSTTVRILRSDRRKAIKKQSDLLPTCRPCVVVEETRVGPVILMILLEVI